MRCGWLTSAASSTGTSIRTTSWLEWTGAPGSAISVLRAPGGIPRAAPRVPTIRRPPALPGGLPAPEATCPRSRRSASRWIPAAISFRSVWSTTRCVPAGRPSTGGSPMTGSTRSYIANRSRFPGSMPRCRSSSRRSSARPLRSGHFSATRVRTKCSSTSAPRGENSCPTLVQDRPRSVGGLENWESGMRWGVRSRLPWPPSSDGNP